jgi:hypothetical protein
VAPQAIIGKGLALEALWRWVNEATGDPWIQGTTPQPLADPWLNARWGRAVWMGDQGRGGRDGRGAGEGNPSPAWSSRMTPRAIDFTTFASGEPTTDHSPRAHSSAS